MSEETKKPNSYTSEFKESAVKLAVESDHPVSATARDLGVNVNTLHTWIGKYSKPKKMTERTDDHIYDENKGYVTVSCGILKILIFSIT